MKGGNVIGNTALILIAACLVAIAFSLRPGVKPDDNIVIMPTYIVDGHKVIFTQGLQDVQDNMFGNFFT